MGRRWTERDRERLTQMALEQEELPVMMKTLGRTIPSITNNLYQLARDSQIPSNKLEKYSRFIIAHRRTKPKAVPEIGYRMGRISHTDSRLVIEILEEGLHLPSVAEDFSEHFQKFLGKKKRLRARTSFFADPGKVTIHYRSTVTDDYIQNFIEDYKTLLEKERDSQHP